MSSALDLEAAPGGAVRVPALWLDIDGNLLNLRIRNHDKVHRAIVDDSDGADDPVVPGCNIGVGRAGHDEDVFRPTSDAIDCDRYGCGRSDEPRAAPRVEPSQLVLALY